MEHFLQHFLTDLVNKALNKYIDKKVRKIQLEKQNQVRLEKSLNDSFIAFGYRSAVLARWLVIGFLVFGGLIAGLCTLAYKTGGASREDWLFMVLLMGGSELVLIASMIWAFARSGIFVYSPSWYHLEKTFSKREGPLGEIQTVLLKKTCVVLHFSDGIKPLKIRQDSIGYQAFLQFLKERCSFSIMVE